MISCKTSQNWARPSRMHRGLTFSTMAPQLRAQELEPDHLSPNLHSATYSCDSGQDLTSVPQFPHWKNEDIDIIYLIRWL